MTQEKERINTAKEMLNDLEIIRGLMMFQWKKSNLSGALIYLDEIVDKIDKIIKLLKDPEI